MDGFGRAIHDAISCLLNWAIRYTAEDSVMDERQVEPTATKIVGGRYSLQRVIGQGGMATVYEAIDLVSGQRVALKQLRHCDDAIRAQRVRESFDYEFHTLSELAHPRIVAVLEYGRDGDLPFYTMELLDGGDLLERSPLPWREACAVARDLCSALSILHSRRFVYRDLSVRNVRFTSDGKPKLIDFGAMITMGPSTVAVCTPSVAAPEVVQCQPLDGRADLYALGATLYFTLVRRNAYRAKTFQQLHERWKRPPRAPSEWIPDIPKALDALVLDLLQLDPQLRPPSAAEVSQRLSAIAGLDSDEQLVTSRAYLTTPALVGRDAQLETVDAHVRRLVVSGKGSALLVRGPVGSGRSRFLEACSVRAKLAGLTVVYASPADAAEGSYGAVEAMVSRLFASLPEETTRAAERDSGVLRVLLPVFRALPQPSEEMSQAEAQNRAQPSLRSFFCSVAAQKALLIAVDDVERIDPDSRALVALLAREARNHPLMVLAATDSEALAASDADRLLSEACHRVILGALEQTETHALLASIFGDVPNLAGAARRMHALAGGNPQSLMRVAQHLLDRGNVRYTAGAWVLPERIDDAELPATMAQALHATVARLDDETRALAQALAECSDERFNVDECLMLTTHGDSARLIRSLNELLADSIIVSTSDGYTLAAKTWVAPLRSAVASDVHRRLARVFRQREDSFRTARHLFRSGSEAEGLDALIEYATASNKATEASPQAYEKLLATLPEDWTEVLETGVALCEKHRRSAMDVYTVQRRLIGVLSQTSKEGNGHFAALTQSLARAAGLDIYESLSDSMEPSERLRRAIAEATLRYSQTPDHDKLFEPRTAIQQLVRAMVAAIGNFARTIDVEEWRQMPRLTALAPLSPAVALVDGLARGFDARISGRFEEACSIYEGVLSKLGDAQAAGLDPTYIYSVRAGLVAILGTLSAALGLPSSERWASEVASYPLYHGSALAIRMLDRLWQGDAAAADRIARERELWRLEQPRQQAGDVVTLLWTLQAHAMSDDLTHTRDCLTSIEQISSKITRTWQPIVRWARGEYERIRGDHSAAMVALDAALSRMQPGLHQIWPLAAGARLRVLCELERFADARTQGESNLQSALEHRLGYTANYIRMPLAFAAAKLGDEKAAWEHVNVAIDTFNALGTRGLNLGLVYETATRVAGCFGDMTAFERYAALCKESYIAHDNPHLSAKYRRLIKPPRRPTLDVTDSMVTSQVDWLIRTCSTSAERLRRAVELLVHTTGAQCGFLYGLVDGVPALCAQTDPEPPPSEIDTAAKHFFDGELSDGRMGNALDTIQTEDGQSPAGSSAEWGGGNGGACYRPQVLTHGSPSGYVMSGLVVLQFEAGRALRSAGDLAARLSYFIARNGDLPARALS